MACAWSGWSTRRVLGEAARSARRTSAPNRLLSAMPTYRVSKGSGVTPRIAKPHAASSMTAARLAARSSQRAGKRCGRCGAICMQNLLAYDVDQLARHDDDALGRTAFKET